ncbi:hypothetical protein GJ744_010171 [Endocarpon pusillum]|uniref:Uncharacterized protein n=1 Tax=Endocarpon pusillum TaxID=364733 RepID=A0A8H7AIR0_9EURO|nr:hypothetical protein GJ744_010171 [Endocarpon pusillum]
MGPSSIPKPSCTPLECGLHLLQSCFQSLPTGETHPGNGWDCLGLVPAVLWPSDVFYRPNASEFPDSKPVEMTLFGSHWDGSNTALSHQANLARLISEIDGVLHSQPKISALISVLSILQAISPNYTKDRESNTSIGAGPGTAILCVHNPLRLGLPPPLHSVEFLQQC